MRGATHAFVRLRSLFTPPQVLNSLCHVAHKVLAGACDWTEEELYDENPNNPRARERESLPQYCFARQQRRRCDVAGVTRWNCEQIVWLKKKKKVQTINWNKDVLATHVALATPKPMNRKLFGNWLFLFVSKSLVCTRRNVIWKCCLNPAE